MATIVPDANKDALEDWASHTLMWIGLGTGYSPNAGHTFLSSLTGSELSGGTYARSSGGTGVRTVNTSSHEVEYDCDPPALGIAGQDCGSVALFDDTGSAATSRVLLIIDAPTRDAGDDLTGVLGAHVLVLRQAA